MKILKTIFWTTLFWLVVLLFIFGYAKYTKGGEGLANSIAKNLGVTPMTEEMMLGSGDMMGSGVMDQYTEIQDMLMELQEDVDLLVEEKMMDEEMQIEEEMTQKAATSKVKATTKTMADTEEETDPMADVEAVDDTMEEETSN